MSLSTNLPAEANGAEPDTAKTPPPILYLTVNDVAARLQISTSSVYLLIEHGQLPHHRVGARRRAIRVSEDDLAAYLNGCREKPREQPVKAAPPSKAKLKHLML